MADVPQVDGASVQKKEEDDDFGYDLLLFFTTTSKCHWPEFRLGHSVGEPEGSFRESLLQFLSTDSKTILNNF